MPTLRTDTGEIEIVVEGDGEQPIIVVHASGTGPHAYARLSTLLTRGPCRTIAPALVGYGATRVSPVGDRVAQNVEVARATLADTRPGGNAILFGHSMGGLIALLTASRAARRNSDGIQAVILFDPILVTLLRTDVDQERTALAWDREIISKLNAAVTARQPEDGVRAFIEAWSGQRWQDMPDTVRKQFVSLAETLLAEATATSYVPLRDEQLQMINLPVMILVGEQSPSIVHLMAARAAALIPDAQVEVIVGADHMAPVHRPQLIAPVIEKFIERQRP